MYDHESTFALRVSFDRGNVLFITFKSDNEFTFRYQQNKIKKNHCIMYNDIQHNRNPIPMLENVIEETKMNEIHQYKLKIDY